ncbi:response regulator [Paenibacillus antri]|uniref:response regulator n=1 Tax=Paenibacillus antri TaxID=2582848 RepID=UPI00130515FF|nr:response regulator [Paenibacillus antri]
MYKLVIVDDNRLEREGLGNVLDWRSLKVDIVGTFANGKQALERFDGLRPDVLLTDIQMPVMNGLQLAEAIREKWPETRIIFMSSYDEFDYARSALRLQVEDYLLKPIRKEALADTVRKTLAALESWLQSKREREGMMRQIKSALSLYREQFWRDLLYGNRQSAEDIHDRLVMLELEPWPALCQVVIVSLAWDETDRSQANVTDKYYYMYMIQKAAKEQPEVGLAVHTAQISDRDIAVIYCAADRGDGSRSMVDAVVRFKERIESLSPYSCAVGVSETSDRLEKLPQLYKQAKLAAETRYFGETPGGRLVLYEEIGRTAAADFETAVDLQELYRDVKSIVADQMPADVLYDKYLEPTRAYSEKYVRTLLLAVMQSIELVYAEAGKKFRDTSAANGFGTAERWSSIADVARTVGAMLESAAAQLQVDNKSQYELMVDEIKAIIAKQYREPITVQTIADQVYMSPSRVNNIFKMITGRTIFDYLTEYRMEKAKELLKDPFSRVYLVAQEVGYANKSHFCLVFRKFTGLSPSAYKDNLFPKQQED